MVETADVTPVGTFEVDLRPSSDRSSGQGEEEEEKTRKLIQLSMDRDQIEAKPNVLPLDDVEVDLVREILFSKINLADFDKREIERFKKDNHSVRRYARLGQDRTSTLYRSAACVKACLEWRKSIELYNLNEDSFSEEVRQLPSIFNEGNRTLQGENIVWMRACDHRRQYNTEEFRRHFAWQLERIDRQSDECGFIICVDCTGAGPSCIDLDLVTYFIKIVLFFRGNMRYVLVHDMGWLLGATWKLIKSWMPQEQRDGVKMVSKKELCQYVASDQLASYMASQ